VPTDRVSAASDFSTPNRDRLMPNEVEADGTCEVRSLGMTMMRKKFARSALPGDAYSGRARAGARQASPLDWSAVRRALNLPSRIPQECRDRPTPEKYRFKPQLRYFVAKISTALLGGEARPGYAICNERAHDQPRPCRHSIHFGQRSRLARVLP
jgi:hypothetical protein